MRSALRLAAMSVAVLTLHLGVGAQHADEKKREVMVTPGDLKWRDGPPSLPKGSQMAVLEGDPSKEGAFVMRAKLPDGYKIPPHTHLKDERVTVISGTLNLGMGSKFDEKEGMALPAGSYARMPAGMKHFGWAKGETVIQLNGEGPWNIEYLDPKDDPRKAK
jgi:quercetin dioxygenase-like cupin family protein